MNSSACSPIPSSDWSDTLSLRIAGYNFYLYPRITMPAEYSVAPLPYAEDALTSKGMSRETVALHYGKHHKGYAVRLNALAKENPSAFANKSIVDIIRSAKPGSLPFNMAAQIFNHDFYWQSMSPDGGVAPTAESALGQQIAADFGGVNGLIAKFSTVAAGHFGSGWCWLVWNKKTNNLQVVGTHDAECPLSSAGLVPLLVCDVWEHAYYVDYRNDRPAFLKNWWRLVNWKFAERNYNAARGQAKL